MPSCRASSHSSRARALPRVVGGPMLDKVEVGAGIWDDGKTFGRAELVKVILSNRTMQESQYDQAASLLQQGLDGNWTRDRYGVAFVEG